MKKIIRTIEVLVAITTATAAGYYMGAYERAQAESAQKTRYIGALMEGLHWYYQGNKQEWHEVFMNTQEYRNIDRANEGDWEDFYYDWN